MAVPYLRPRLAQRIREKKMQLDHRRPLPRAALAHLREELAVEWTYHSNAIEGNTLTLRETRLVLEHGITVAGKSLREHLEARNHAEAITALERFVHTRRPIVERDILDIHAIVVKGIEEEFAGRYRTGQVRITGASLIPPNAAVVPERMAAFTRWLRRNPDRLNPVTLAAFTHYEFVAIHPFFDGNGRTARLLMNLILMRHGYPPAVVPVTDRKRYYAALEAANRGDRRPFVNLMAQYVERMLTRYLDAVGSAPDDGDLLSLARLAPKTPYTAGYLSLLARRGELAAEKRGKTWYASPQAVEEYRRRRLCVP